ncbi:MAG: peptidase M28 family protein [Cytophagales bacterium]|nr:MAG: peptidase M28 family protein [Cytophagales bacterium]
MKYPSLITVCMSILLVQTACNTIVEESKQDANGKKKSSIVKEDSIVIQQLYTEALQNPQGYYYLDTLCNQIGARLSGSEGAQKAVVYCEKVMKNLGFDKVYLQPVKVPKWVRGNAEKAFIIAKSEKIPLKVCALGNSIGTGEKGAQAEIIEVKDFETLKQLGEEKIKGKIVFFNRSMNPAYIETFTAYGQASNQRVQGASEAAKYGAIAVIVRSMTTNLDDIPHTGTLRYQLNVPQIPAVAISTNDAEKLSKAIKNDPNTLIYLETHCQNLGEVDSYNVIGEITGTEKPEEIIVVGGHLDSWDLAQGAHDDGTGCMQSIEVLRLFKKNNIKPKRTIRAVMFMNEENGLNGGRTYAQEAKNKKEKHIVAIESDSGGFIPLGFSVDNDQGKLELMQQWIPLLEPFQLFFIKKGYGGADISPLRDQGTILIALRPDSQRYFDYHHTAIDTFDKVNPREMQMGAAAMATLIFLLDKYL